MLPQRLSKKQTHLRLSLLKFVHASSGERLQILHSLIQCGHHLLGVGCVEAGAIGAVWVASCCHAVLGAAVLKVNSGQNRRCSGRTDKWDFE